MKYINILFFICFPTLIYTQNIFYGVIDSYINKEVTITLQYGDDSRIVDRVITGQNGNFSYDFSNDKKGLYRVYLENNESFDIIFADEPEVEIFTRAQNAMYNMLIIQSEQNKQLYRFIRENLFATYKIDLLKQFKDIYPDDDFIKKIDREINSLKRKDRRNIRRQVRKNSDSFAGRYISYFKRPNPPRRFDDYKKNQYIKNNFLEYFDFTDEEMIYSDAYPNIVFDYIMMHRENESELLKAAKEILNYVQKQSDNDLVFNFIFNYILKGFESLEMFEICAKLSTKYSDVCPESDENLSLRIRSYTETGRGMRAPDIIAKDIHGKKIVLSEIEADFFVLVFWATWCEHCKDFINKMQSLGEYFDEKNISVIGVSLDYDERELRSYLSENKMEWTVISDFNAWEGQIVNDYAVYATPTIFVLDKNLKIIEKPMSFDEFKRSLEYLHIY